MANDRAHAKEDRVLPKVGINLSGTAIPYSEMLEVSMSDSRQRIAIAAAVLAASLATLAVLSNAQTSHPTRQPPQRVPRQTLRIRISLPDSKGLMPKGLIPSRFDKQNQAGLRSDIEKLYALAFVLREQMKTTDTSSTMSVSIVQASTTKSRSWPRRLKTAPSTDVVTEQEPQASKRYLHPTLDESLKEVLIRLESL